MEQDRNQGVLRLAVAMRGGVSLAVWIGGALAEIDRVCRIDDDPFAQALRDITRFDRVEVDILTGASAGGLNAALGAMALAHKKRMNLREMWIETADIDRLLESSTNKPRRSLLDGEFFKDEVISQLEMLKKSAPVLPGAEEQHVDAFLAATVFGGVEVTDQADPRFSDQRQEAYFHFRHQADNPAFSDLIRSDAPRSLGLAARASASFPAAFEPMRIEVGEFNGELNLPPTEPRPTTVRLLDGGVVDNIPVARAIEAAARVPASEAVRRWVVFLHPSPTLSDPEAHKTKGPDTPSVFNVLAGLAKGLGAETLLDDLDVLRRHNREAESQQIQRVTLCERALATLDPTVEQVLGEVIETALGVPPAPPLVNRSLGSADADCLYALLDNPGAFQQWVPVRSVPPASPIRDRDESQRYGIRSHFIAELVNRPRSVRPFAQIIRLAFLTIEWIRWVGKLPEPKPPESELAVMRCRAYDILLVAQLIDSALERCVVTVADDYLGTLELALAAAEASGALSTLVDELSVPPSGDSTKPLVDRLKDPSREVLEVLAAGLLPEPGWKATDGTSDALLRQLAKVCHGLARASAHRSGSTPSVFTFLARAIEASPDPSEGRAAICLLTVDAACAGLHRGRGVGTPHNLDYIRISGARSTPFADLGFEPGLLPKFTDIHLVDGQIDPAEKLSGNKLANFSAFVSRRFRANDWMWGRMDSAAGLVELLIRPSHLLHGVTCDDVKRAVTCAFPTSESTSRDFVSAAETLCSELWVSYEEEVEHELAEAQALSVNHDPIDDPYLVRTRQLLLTRWQLGLLIAEVPEVLAQPLEPGDAAPTPPSAPDGFNPRTAIGARAQMQSLLDRYESSPRRVTHLWGTRRTTALGIRVADRVARAVIPGGGPVSQVVRALLVSPLFMVAIALLSRGAFLIASNLLVDIVLAPRLRPVAHLVVVLVAIVLSLVFWGVCVSRPKPNAWRGYLSGFVALCLIGIGIATTWWHPLLLQAPTSVHASSPWTALKSTHWHAAWSAATIGVAAALATWCLWIWARLRWRLIAVTLTGAAFAWWQVVGAWRKNGETGWGWSLQAIFGSMWFPAIFLVLICTIVILRLSPEDRPGPESRPPPPEPDWPITDGPQTVTEIRVHGVGGSPGPRLLGYEDDTNMEIDRPQDGIEIRHRRDASVQVLGFDWGALTSGSPIQAAWVFLLPFTLLNAAGWAHPPSRAHARFGQAQLVRSIVVVLGWLLTATCAFWVADLFVEYGGYQWLPRAAGEGTHDVPVLPFGWWHVQLSQNQIRAVGVSIGGLISVAFVGLVWFIARRAKSKVKEHRGPIALDRKSAVFDDDFFKKRPAWWASTLLHLGIAFAAIALCVVQAFVALGSHRPPTTSTIDKTLVVAGGLQLALLTVFGVLFVLVPVVFRRANARVSWAAAVLAFATTNAFLSGTVLLLTRYLARHSSVKQPADLTLGSELVLVNAFFLVAVLWAAIIGIAVLMRTRRRGIPAVCSADQPIPEAWRMRVRAAQGTAFVVHKIDLLVVALAVAFAGVGVSVGVARAHAATTWPWDWAIDPPNPNAFGYTIAAWALPAFVAFVLVRVRAAAGDNRTRRFFGQFWDVLAFWPRQFHPFAVRPYSYVAVPELRSQINNLRETGSVIVSAHSQGSVLAVSALAPETDLGDVALVTYGSHVPTLYRRSFNAYFNVDAVTELHAKLADTLGSRWHNFYRLTDPIGGPMFTTASAACGDGPGIDHCLPDPAVASEPSVEIPAPLERDREPGADLAVHSHYLNEPGLKQCVRALRSRLSQPVTATAGDTPPR